MRNRPRVRPPSLAASAFLIAIAALFVALGGPGYAATGGSFILGQSNSTNDTSVLAGSPAGDQLDVANLNTGASAKGLGVLGKSPTAPAANVANAGGGPALSLTVNNGASPFTTSSAVKVANLNADLLDGLDQSAFLPATGKAVDSAKLEGLGAGAFTQAGSGTTTILTNRMVVPPHTYPGLLYLPGLGYIFLNCPPVVGGTHKFEMQFTNASGSTLDYWTDISGYTVGNFLAPGATANVAYYLNGRQYGNTFALGFSGEYNSPYGRAVFVQPFVFQASSDSWCGGQATATMWSR